MKISYYVIPGLSQKGVTTRDHVYERVTRLVCQHLEVPFKEVFKKTRKREVCLVRQISMYLIKTHYPPVTLMNLGVYFGGRDHTTVIHSIAAIKTLMQCEPEWKSKVDKIEGYI